MKAIDKYLQKVRITKAKKYVRYQDAVLDIGSADGTMFEQWNGFIKTGFGIDPTLPAIIKKDGFTLIPGYFPATCPAEITFDAITMLAVLEHIPTTEHEALATQCFNLLNEKGRIIITVPSPKVDYILHLLLRLKWIDGMQIKEHYGFKPSDTINIFDHKKFVLLHKKTFQFGLNNLFVFEKR